MKIYFAISVVMVSLFGATTYSPSSLAAPASQVRPSDPNPSPQEDRMADLEAKIDKVLEISKQTLAETRQINSSIDGLKKSNTDNAVMIVDAIKSLSTTSSKAESSEIEKKAEPRFETRWVQECGPDGCRWVQETVEIRDGVQPTPPTDPPGFDPGPPSGPGQPGGDNCGGARNTILGQFVGKIAIRRAVEGRMALFPRIRSLFVR